jgi:hypothetical protein
LTLVRGEERATFVLRAVANIPINIRPPPFNTQWPWC